MSQINESDLAALLASESKEAHAKMDETVKAKKLNPNASEFEPAFDTPAVAASTAPQYVQGYYPPPSQPYAYYEPYQAAGSYYDPNYYYSSNPYYAQASYYPNGGYQSYTYQGPQDPHQAPPKPDES